VAADATPTTPTTSTTGTTPETTGETPGAPRRRKRLAIVLSTLTLALVATTVGFAAMGDEMTLSIDGRATQIRTSAATVGEVLDDQGVEIGDHDVVVPSLDTPVRSGSRIAVRFGRPLQVNVDGKKSSHWVTATSVSSAVRQIGLRLGEARLSASRSASIDRDGMSLTVVTPKKLSLVLLGRKPVRRTMTALTVGQALRMQGVQVDGNDLVRPSRGRLVHDGDRITFSRVTITRHRVNDERIGYTTITRSDSSMDKGDTEVVRAGRAGSRDVVYRLRKVNGEVVGRQALKVSDRHAPVAAIVKVGTKEPAPAPTANYASGGTVWDQIAQCESGGNWAINTGNGYYGGLQFNLSTWHSYGGSGYPNQNSRETQIMIAERVRAATGGYGSWPGCASALGLPM
jgi:uncharacterized protein YabE (DUF348 family)